MSKTLVKYTDEQICTIITKALLAFNVENSAKSVILNALYEIAYNHTCTTDFNIKLEALLMKVNGGHVK